MTSSPRLPRWVVFWLGLSTLVVIWDALFVLCRPASFPGNTLGFIWSPAYRIYLSVDHGYADLENKFVATLAIMTLLESCVVAVLLWLNRKGGHGLLPHLLAVVVTCLTGAKTLIFFLHEGLAGWPSIGHNDLLPLVFGYIIPNGIWIVVPFTAAFATGRHLLHHASD